MSSSDSDSHSDASQGNDSHSRLLESIARCPQAIKDLSDTLMPALINNLEHIAEHGYVRRSPAHTVKGGAQARQVSRSVSMG